MVASLQDCRGYTGIMFEVCSILEKPAIPIVYGPGMFASREPIDTARMSSGREANPDLRPLPGGWPNFNEPGARDEVWPGIAAHPDAKGMLGTAFRRVSRFVCERVELLHSISAILNDLRGRQMRAPAS